MPAFRTSVHVFRVILYGVKVGKECRIALLTTERCSTVQSARTIFECSVRVLYFRSSAISRRHIEPVFCLFSRFLFLQEARSNRDCGKCYVMYSLRLLHVQEPARCPEL